MKVMGDVVELCVCDRPIFREEGFEAHLPRDKLRPGRATEKSEKSEKAPDVQRSARRAAQMLREYALCNRLPLFVTFTLDGAKIDRYDPAAITKKIHVWLDNRVRRNGLQYLIVAEWHKDGAVHFHGLINDVLPKKDSGTMIPPGGGKPRKPRSQRQRAEWLEQGGQIVYNLPSWSLGFSAAVLVRGDYHRTVNYVCKYITKQKDDPRGKVGGRWYYHSNNLERAEQSVFWWSMDEALAAGGHLYYVPEAGRSFVYLTASKEEFQA
ncbi:MAG: hypothetical protein ACI3U8_02680 [Candidatus Onthomonas sp.]